MVGVSMCLWYKRSEIKGVCVGVQLLLGRTVQEDEKCAW